MKDWQAAMDQIKNRGCSGIRYRKRKGMGNPRRRMRCSEIHKSELAKEIPLKRSSPVECEWNMKDWQAASGHG
jgi:hypothetical protein